MDVVIVDDQPSARTLLRQVLRDLGPQISAHDFGAPEEALKWCEAHRPDLLLLDYRMPGMDGLQLARAIRKPLHNRDVPIVLVTVVDDEPVRQAALDAGIIDFIHKPIRPRDVRARCRNLLQLCQQTESVKQRALSLEERLLASMHEVEQRERETLHRLARAIELRDIGTSAYLERMAHIAGLIAENLRLPESQVHLIELAAPLHDIGKIAIPDAILMKPGPLDEAERAHMMRHPRIGYELLQDSQNRFIQIGAQIALRHHEHWNGGGYPDGLAGEQIPLEARIVTVADVLDALLSPRPYKAPWSLDQALAYIASRSGSMFDPACVRALMADVHRLQEICERYSHIAPRREWR